MTKLQVKNSIYYYGVSSKPNADIIGIIVSMCKHNIFKTIFTSDDVLNIKYAIGKIFGYREEAFYMGINFHFPPLRTNIPHVTSNYGPGQSKSEINYYRQTYYFPEKFLTHEENKKNRVKK